MARIYAAIENFEMNLKSCSCLNLGVFERKRDDTKEVGGGGKFMAGAGVGNSGVQSACKELFRFNERRKIWLNCEQLCFAFCVHPGGEGGGWKRKRVGIRGVLNVMITKRFGGM